MQLCTITIIESFSETQNEQPQTSDETGRIWQNLQLWQTMCCLWSQCWWWNSTFPISLSKMFID